MLGIVHGCLCTGNVLLDDALQPIVAEAGSVPVHAAAERFGNDAQIYVAFAAPEVVKGEAATVRSDVYSLGRILEDTLKGDPPNAELEAIVRRCTAGLPSARYSEAGELASALEAVVGLLPAEEPAPRTITSIPAPRTSTWASSASLPLRARSSPRRSWAARTRTSAGRLPSLSSPGWRLRPPSCGPPATQAEA
jgi:serine/threonine protein kinase